MLNRDYLEQNGLLTKLTQSVYDPEFTKALKKAPWAEWCSEEDPFDCRSSYLERYRAWIGQSKLNHFTGLESFKRIDLINGTTQSFDEAYHRHANRRLRIFRGEYGYHKRVCPQFVFIEDAPLERNDYAIVSVPFCSTGKVHEGLATLLSQAESLGVPVLIDCAYYGTCYGLSFNFNHPAIESVSFSLTKGLGLGRIRSGIRFSNLKDHFPICQQNDFDHSIQGAAQIGLYMMNQFDPDFIPLKYRDMQQSLCHELGLEASPCVHLALGNEHWRQYLIDDKYSRVGIRNLIAARRKGLL